MNRVTAGGFRFRPALLPTLATLVILPVLLALGFWQLDRARQKESLQAVYSARVELPYAAFGEVDPADPAFRYRHVEARGRYDDGHQLLLDNQVLGGRPGYRVLTPLRLAGIAQAVLVDRGWLPWGQTRAQLPVLAVTGLPVTVRGRLDQPPSPGLRLGDAADGRSWPRVIQYVDYGQLAGELGYPLAPAVILLDPDQPQGYRREWALNFGTMSPERHRGYAVQWFALAATLVILYLTVNTRRRRRPDDSDH